MRVNEITLIFQSNSLTAIVLPCMNLPELYPQSNIRIIDHSFTFRKGGWGSLCCLHDVKDLNQPEISEAGEVFCFMSHAQERGRSDSSPSQPAKQPKIGSPREGWVETSRC